MNPLFKNSRAAFAALLLPVLGSQNTNAADPAKSIAAAGDLALPNLRTADLLEKYNKPPFALSESNKSTPNPYDEMAKLAGLAAELGKRNLGPETVALLDANVNSTRSLQHAWTMLHKLEILDRPDFTKQESKDLVLQYLEQAHKLVIRTFEFSDMLINDISTKQKEAGKVLVRKLGEVEREIVRKTQSYSDDQRFQDRVSTIVDEHRQERKSKLLVP